MAAALRPLGRLPGHTVRFWLEAELADIFDVSVRPSAQTADAIYDQVADRLAKDGYRPRALYDRFRIQVLATTDDPADDLSAHAALAADPTWAGRVVPTFRPDRYLEPAQPGWGTRWPGSARWPGSTPGTTPASWPPWRRGAGPSSSTARSPPTTATSTSAPTRWSRPRRRIYRTALAGEVTEAEATALRRHLLLEMARMSCDDGLVMTLHPGVRRGHHGPTTARFGADTGNDLPIRVEFTDALRPLLERYGTHPNLHLVLFTLDETVFSRELAPLAGFYPALYVGVPWWFLDAPEAIRRFRAAVTETAGFSRTSGFVDDTRAFCSIPARHDMSRRVDAGLLAQLVAEHRLDEDEATETALDLVTGRPREVFKL